MLCTCFNVASYQAKVYVSVGADHRCPKQDLQMVPRVSIVVPFLGSYNRDFG